MSDAIKISIENGSFGYRKNGKELLVLADVNLECREGELIGMAGLNGSGKSTLLRTMAGLQASLSGKVKINEKELSLISRSDMAHQVSMVTTEKISGFNLTCYDAVAAGRIPYTNMFHELKEEDKKVIASCMEQTGITAHAEKLLSELSDGLYQKTMIARALAQQTDIMILDEPGAFLDFASKHELFLLLARFCKENNKCILVSSHELDLLLKYCSKIALVNKGAVRLMPTEAAKQDEVFRGISGGFL